MLLIVNGITNLVAAGFLFAKKKTGYYLGGLFGITLMAWIIIQFCTLPANFMSTIYFFFGLFQFIAGACAVIFYKQAQFKFDKNAYKIPEKSEKQAFYFSRCGYTAKLAYETAEKQNAAVEEITTPENISGNLGFFWCGRFAMHAWEMPINTVSSDLTDTNEVIIVSPVWAFKMCAPVRGFIKAHQSELASKKVTFIFNHFNPWLPSGAVKELKALLPSAEVYSYVTHYGVTKKAK